MIVVGGEQLDMFATTPGPRARRADPITSQNAAARMAKWWATQAGQVLRELIRGGPGNGHQLARRLGPGWTNVKVCRRLSDLSRQQLVRHTGQVSDEGHQWSATAKGLARVGDL